MWPRDGSGASPAEGFTAIKKRVALEFRGLPCGVSKVKYFNKVLVFANLVVDQDRTVQEFAHSRALSNGATHGQKTSK
jgi:hypothetical protein